MLRPFTIRDASVRDAEAIARVHIESSEDAYAPLARTWIAPDREQRTRAWAERLAAEASDATRFVLVAEVDGELVGFLSAGPSRRQDVDADLEIYVIHVLPLHRGRDVGGALWRAACPRLRGPGLRSMHVQTLAELRCCSFYEARGGKIVERRPGEFHGAAVTEVVYHWSPGHSSEARPYALRTATADDFEFLHALKRAAYREHVVATYGAWDEQWQRDRLASRFDPAAVQIVVVDGQAVGQLVVVWDEDPVFLVAIELVPEVRGRGLGTAILLDVLDRARGKKKGVRLQVFEVNGRARRLYERLGFLTTGSTETHTLMLWSAT
jgi:GNAT superfamily N-acetyltransferase